MVSSCLALPARARGAIEFVRAEDSTMSPIRFLRAALPAILVALSTFGALGVSGCATDRQVIAQADDTHKQLQPAVIEDPMLHDYLQALGTRIVQSAHALSDKGYGPKSHFKDNNDWMFSDKMQFHFVNSKTLNAFTTGGDHMYVYTELLQSCRTEDELAAVMAHEYGHVYARHVAKGMDRQYGVLAGAAALGVTGAILGGKKNALEYGAAGAAGGYAIGSFLGMGYTRVDEAEADDLGFTFYTHAGWDPSRFGDFFQQMIDKGFDKTPAIASDHPTLASRVKVAKQHVADLPPDAASWRKPNLAPGAKFEEMKQRAAQIAKTTPSDEKLKTAQTLLSAVPSCLLPEDQPEQKDAQAKIKKAVEEQQKADGAKK
jgi:predicted Zn-dependent protease